MFLHLKGYAMLVSLQMKLVLKITILLSAVYFGLTVYTVLMAPKELTELLYSESSAYEVFSYWLWGWTCTSNAGIEYVNAIARFSCHSGFTHGSARAGYAQVAF